MAAGLALTHAQAFERPGVANSEPSAAEFDDARVAPCRELLANELARHAQHAREIVLREVKGGRGGMFVGWRARVRQGDDLSGQAGYAAEVLESAFDALAALPGADEEQLRAGLENLRSLPDQPGAGLGWVVHKSTAAR